MGGRFMVHSPLLFCVLFNLSGTTWVLLFKRLIVIHEGNKLWRFKRSLFAKVFWELGKNSLASWLSIFKDITGVFFLTFFSQFIQFMIGVLQFLSHSASCFIKFYYFESVLEHFDIKTYSKRRVNYTTPAIGLLFHFAPSTSNWNSPTLTLLVK